MIEGQVVFIVQTLNQIWDCDTYTVTTGTVARDYNQTLAVNIGDDKQVLVTKDQVFESELAATASIVYREMHRAEQAESIAAYARKQEDEWRHRLDKLQSQ